jgi:multiple sugar transport system permease protein
MKGAAAKWGDSLQYVFHAVLIVCLVIMLYPTAFMAMNSLKTSMAINYNPESLPDFRHLNWGSYSEMAEDLDILNLFKNTLVIIVVLVFSHLIVNAGAAYALDKIPFPGKNALFKVMLWTIMIPSTILIIPTYILMSSFGWVDTYLPLIVPGVVSVYDTFLIRQFMKGIPNEFVEAAHIDGASHPYIFLRIILPMSTPVLLGVGIMLAMGTWNDLQGPLFYIRDEAKFTVQLALFRFSQDQQIDLMAAKYAGMTATTVPVVILFLLAQKHFMKAFGSTFSLK